MIPAAATAALHEPDVNEHARPQRRTNFRKRFRLDLVEPTQGKEGHIGDALRRQNVDQRVIAAIDQIIVVLHADHGRNALRLFDLGAGGVTQPQMSDQALLLQFRQCGIADRN